MLLFYFVFVVYCYLFVVWDYVFYDFVYVGSWNDVFCLY